MSVVRMYDVIDLKRRGGRLSGSQIKYWIDGYVRGDIPDYQTAALLMAIAINGMDREETAALTAALIESGEVADLSSIDGVKVDKHSTGGVGDKTTLIIAPLLAAAGLKVAKMSGRGLGHTGGTLDKLESIDGFNTALSIKKMISVVNTCGLCIVGQTDKLVPADKLLYALRDVTATVNSLPLIASSIMSKKLAVGADIIILDVKYGRGSFMPDVAAAESLANLMIDIGNSFNKKVSALITAMEQPLGNAVGNAVELMEALDTLKGGGPEDLRTISLTLAAEALYRAEMSDSRSGAYAVVKDILQSGEAFEKFRAMVADQGGNTACLDNRDLFGAPRFTDVLTADSSGYITALDALKVGQSALELGAGRKSKSDNIDYSAGIYFNYKVGDYVHAGDDLAVLYTNNKEAAGGAKQLLQEAYVFRGTPPVKQPLITRIVG